MQHHRSRFRRRTLFLFLPLLVFMAGFLLFGSNFAVEAQASDASNACAITPELLDGQGRYSVAGLGRYSVAGLGRYSVAGLGRYSVAGLAGFTEEQVEALINEIINNPISATWIQDPYNLISVGAGFNSGKVALLVIDDFSVVEGAVPAHGGQVRQVIDDLLATLPALNIDVFNVNIGDGNNNYRMDAIASTVEALVTDLRTNQGYEHFVLNMSFGIVPCSDPSTGFNFDDFIAEREASAQPQPITPIVECVIEHGEGAATIRFGYQNNNPFVVEIPAGERNAVFRDDEEDYDDYSDVESYIFGGGEGTLDRGQPTIFQPGYNTFVFTVNSPFPLTWTIEYPDGSVQSATADEDTPDCEDIFLEPAYKVSPVLECVADNQDGTYTAYFGYNNPNAGPVYIPAGGNNRFNPNPRDRGQPRYFAPGRHQFVFEVTFTSGNLVWRLHTPGFSASTSTAGTGAATIECNPLAKQTGSQYGLLQYLTEVLGLDLDDALAYLNNLLTGSQFSGVHDDGSVPTLGGLRELLQQYLSESANPNSNFALFAIASSGNYGDLLTDPLAPARWQETIAVSALLGGGGLWPFSQNGNIAMPGAWYPFNFDDDDDIELYGAGTSYSAPFLSLVAALWMTYEDKEVCNFTATFPPLRNPGQLGNRDYTELDCEVPLNGDLTVTKDVETFGFTVEQTFEICIDSDEIDAPLCRDFNSANGFTQTFEDIPAGSYLITETAPGASWTVGGDNGVSVEVTAGEIASATISNTYNPPDSQICSAVEVINFSQGPARVGNPSADRSNPANALGAPQNTDAPPVNFVSLGFGGSITLRLTGAVYNNAGSDLFVVETSYGSPSCSSYPEKANVEVSQDGVTYYAITAGTPNLCVDGGVDITNTGDLAWIQYIRITDVSNRANFSNNQSSDGYDVDGILCDAPIRPGSIKVIKYNDANGNGRKDSGEGGLSGWSFTVNGVTQTTGSNGQTVFSNLAPGNYQVCETLREGWTNTDPSNGSGCKTVTVREGRQTEVKIGNRQNPPATGSITIIKEVVTTGSTSTEFFFEVRKGAATIADSIELGDGASETVDNLPAGTYTVEELFSSFGSGFSFGGAVCTHGDEEVSIPADVTGNNTKIDVEVGVGEDWTCTFTNYDRPSLVIYKQTDIDGDTTLFTFNQNVRPSLPPTFTLADDDFQQYFEFGAGVFTVTEDTQSGWLLDDVICTGATGVVDVTGGVEITFDWGDTVTCTFYNVADPVETGSITIIKTVISEGNPTTEFPYEVLQGDTVIEDNIDVAGGGSYLVDNLTPGTYTVDELFEVGYGSGWVFGGAVCTNGDEEVSIPRDDSGNASEITVEVGEGEDWTCEFTNYAKSALRIEKQTDVDGDPTVFVFDLTGFVIPSVNLADNASEFRPELKGDVKYTIVEQPQAGWTLDSVVCTGGTVTEIENGIEIVLGWGVSLKCTFNNVQAEDDTRSITIQKSSAEPGYDAQVYFDGDLPDVNGANPGDFNTNGMDGLYTFENLEPGVYTVTELVPDGWDLVSVTCNGEVLTITNNSVEIDATEADRTCTFNNAPESLQADEGSITIVKQTVYNSSYGSASDTTFFFGGDLGAFDLITGESEPFTAQAAGTYVVTESVAQGWDLTGLTCAGDTDNGTTVDLNQQKATIDLDDGENIICTFTNTRLTGTLTFVKDFVGDAVPNIAWQFTLDGANFTTINGEGSSANFTLPTDMYTVGEVVPQGYDLTSIQCGDAGQISDPAGDDFELLVLSGQNVTCTFTNEAEDTPPPPYEEPELFCPAGYTQFNLVTHGALLTQQYNQSYAGEFWLPEDSDGFLRVWSRVGHPEAGCPDSGAPICENQDGESFYVNIADQQFFVPDHGNDQWAMFDFDLDLTRNMWQYGMDHSFQATNNEFGSVNFNAVYCAQPAEVIIEEPVDEPVEEPIDEPIEQPAPENRNPALSVINLFSFVGEQIDLTISAQDEDNDTLSFSFTGLPAGLSYEAATGRVFGTIGAVNETTNFTVQVTVSDGNSGTATASFIWTVQPVAAPPVSNLTNTEGDVINVVLPTLNYPGLTLTFDYAGLPTGLTFDPTTGSVSGTAPQVDGDTVFNVTLTVTLSAPGEGSASAVVNFTWTILNVPDAALTSLEAVPVEQPPVEQPPVEQPPVEQPPVEQPPAESTEGA